GERGALSVLALRLDLTSVEHCDLLHQGEADSGARVLARLAAVGLVKAIEDPGEFVRADANARVENAQVECHLFAAGRDVNMALLRELERVRQEVDEQPVGLLQIEKQGGP